MGFVVLLLSSTEGWSLPPCEGSPASSWNTIWTWTDCFGTYTYANLKKYVGEWKDANRHGQGTYTYASGNKYVGEFKDDKKHGQGTHTFANGRVKEGIWEKGEFKYAKNLSPTN